MLSSPEIILAPSILGLSPSGTQLLGETLLENGLAKRLGIVTPVVEIPLLNHLYSAERDPDTRCINTKALREFSIILSGTLSGSLDKDHFPIVLGGDCSILLGIMPALKRRGRYGLVFMDAHADFYQPEKSVTGQTADMDLALVTGRGPEMLTNINGLRPYVEDELVIHIGQRDQEETRQYGSQEIRNTAISCISLQEIMQRGVEDVTAQVAQQLEKTDVSGYWLHFDTDVLSDDINPAVDYRLPGGLGFPEAGYIIGNLLSRNLISGISITIFNPALDEDGSIARNITDSLVRALGS